jgi:hypothetical protein
MVRRVFIYGRFVEEGAPTIGSLLVPELPGLPTEAIEILREPTVLELVGKVYVLTSNRNYLPVTPLGVRSFTWYQEYQNAAKNKAKFNFHAQDGDLWHVPWIRQESDEAGAYMAVGLKHDSDNDKIAKLEQEVQDLNQMVIGLVNKLNRVPESILLGPDNPVPGWITKLKP